MTTSTDEYTAGDIVLRYKFFINMKLCYWGGNNFGDKLNPYIFEKLLPNFFDGDDKLAFVGIGSILNFDEVKKNEKKIIFST